jgi:hypothetical protein
MLRGLFPDLGQASLVVSLVNGLLARQTSTQAYPIQGIQAGAVTSHASD